MGPGRKTTLHDFGSNGDGSAPWDLVIGANGVLYGTTENGGTYGAGTVFALTPPVSEGSWTENVLYNFTGGSDGEGPYAGLALGSDGVLYGTADLGGGGNCASGCGTVFSLTPPASPGGGWTEAVLYSFTGGRDGPRPNAGVVIGKYGVLYGTTFQGGTRRLFGTVYALKP